MSERSSKKGAGAFYGGSAAGPPSERLLQRARQQQRNRQAAKAHNAATMLLKSGGVLASVASFCDYLALPDVAALREVCASCRDYADVAIATRGGVLAADVEAGCEGAALRRLLATARAGGTITLAPKPQRPPTAFASLGPEQLAAAIAAHGLSQHPDVAQWQLRVVSPRQPATKAIGGSRNIAAILERRAAAAQRVHARLAQHERERNGRYDLKGYGLRVTTPELTLCAEAGCGEQVKLFRQHEQADRTSVLVVHAPEVTLRGLATRGGAALRLGGAATDAVVEGCDFRGQVHVAEGAVVLIKGSKIHGAGRRLADEYGTLDDGALVVHGIAAIEDCVVEDGHAHGIQVNHNLLKHGQPNPTGEVTITGTTIRRCEGAGLAVKGRATVGKRCSITDNTLSGIYAWDEIMVAGNGEGGPGEVTVEEGADLVCEGNNTSKSPAPHGSWTGDIDEAAWEAAQSTSCDYLQVDNGKIKGVAADLLRYVTFQRPDGE